MAFTKKIGIGDETTFDGYYISHAVGANAANFWTDIMVVQCLLSNLYRLTAMGKGKFGAIMNMREINNLPDPNTEFKPLKKTAALIKRFQTDLRKKGVSNVIDGRFDVASNNLTAVYGIDNVNIYLYMAVRDLGLNTKISS